MHPFKEVSVGGLTNDQLIQKLVDAGIKFNTYAKVLFDHTTFCSPPETKKIKLVKLKLIELNLKNPCSYEAICVAASGFGLLQCPLYLAAYLRLAYLDQAEGPYLTIASPPPENDENYPTGFYVRNFEGSLWLRGYRVVGEADWPVENEFVFQN